MGFPMRNAGRFLTPLSIALLLAATPSDGQEERSPRAGESYTGTVFGKPMTVLPRDRTRVTEIGLGFQWIPDGPEERVIVPSGGLLLWRNTDGGDKRFRAVLSGLYDDVRYWRAVSARSPWEVFATFENTTLPFARSEYAEGERIAAEELNWGYVRAGAGFGYRRGIAPGQQDNAFEATLAYEPGYLYFSTGSDTETGFVVPRDTYEGRVHARARADAFERNILELPHRGWAVGLDAWAGWRSTWEDWGGSVSGIQSGSRGRSWEAISFYAMGAIGVPGVAGERHTLLGSVYGGTGHDLDRFSAFRLGGGSNAGDFETLTQPILPAAAFEEFYTTRYGIADLEYRYELFFFLFLTARGTLARLDELRFRPDGTVATERSNFAAATASLTTGLPWGSSLEIAYSYNGQLHNPGEGKSGRGAIYVFWTKEFRRAP